MRTARKILVAICVLACIGAVDAPHIVGQLLAYQDGYVFFTDGNGFKVSPTVKILDDSTKTATTKQPRARAFARAIFNDAGEVIEIDLSPKAFPFEPLNPLVENYIVAASPRSPNPDLTKAAPVTHNGVPITFSGKLVLVTFTVLVPPTTPLTAQVYMATDQSSWNPQAIQMDRIDALHFRAARRLASGTILHYVYTRGSLQSAERAENGLDREPRDLVVPDADVRTINEVVYQWGDQSPVSGAPIQPNVVPTPYNPAPFPNLPSSIPTPHP